MPSPITAIPESDTRAAIIERARVLKEQGLPALFDINVSRRNNSGVPMQLASFANATLDHVMDPLRWLPGLLGGGEYILNVRHPDLPERIGGPLGVNIDKTQPGMEPRGVDPRVTRLPTWSGPSLVGGAYTEPPPNAPGAQNGHAGATVISGFGMPAPSYGAGSVFAASPQQDRERELSAQLAETRALLARTEAEAKARAELEAERRASAERLREVERRAEQAQKESEQRSQQQFEALRAQIATAPKPDTGSGWKDFISLALPLVQQMLTSQQEMRILMLKMNEDQNRRTIEASEKQHAMQMELIRAVSQKPGMSDELKMLIETLKDKGNNNGSDAISTFMTKQLEAMGMMSRMATDLVQVAAEINMGDSEHPATGMIRAAVDAMKAMSAGAKEAGQKIIPKKQPQLPPGMSPQQYAAWAAQQQRARAAAAQAQRQPQPGQQRPQQPPPPRGPAVVNVAPPPQQPQPQAAPPQTPPAEVTHFAEPPAPPEAGPQMMQTSDGTFVTHFDILVSGVKDKKPVEDVVGYFAQLKNADEISLKQKLDQYGGSPWNLIKGELGMGFVIPNASYLEELGEAIDARGIEEGWWPDDEDEGDEGEEESAEAEGEDTEAPPPTFEHAPVPVFEAPPVPVPGPALAVVPEPPQS